jgi:thiol-disulfide isomerase/thioredoxin
MRREPGTGLSLPGLAALLAGLVVVAGCTTAAGPGGGAGPPGDAAAPFADCAGLAAPPPRAPTPPSAAGSAAGAVTLPEIALPCYAGGTEVSVAGLRGPAVVNLWASWCAPCIRELPVLQRFADRNAGRVHVVGVVSADERAAASALGQELGVRFPALFDSAGALMRELSRSGLPVTLFVDDRGAVRLLYTAEALDAETLDRLAERHLGLVPA